jgi:excisionase family DNA binding protein
MTTEKLFYSRHEAAALLNLSVITIDRLVKANKLPCRRLGRRVLFTLTALQQFAATATVCQ